MLQLVLEYSLVGGVQVVIQVPLWHRHLPVCARWNYVNKDHFSMTYMTPMKFLRSFARNPALPGICGTCSAVWTWLEATGEPRRSVVSCWSFSSDWMIFGCYDHWHVKKIGTFVICMGHLWSSNGMTWRCFRYFDIHTFQQCWCFWPLAV